MQEDSNYSRIQTLAVGIIILTVGVIFFLHNLIPSFHVGNLWPLFMLIPVVPLVFVWIRGKEKSSGVVLPIVVLIFFCVYFLWLNYTHWSNVADTWPNFLIGPGLGFLALYFVSRLWGYLIPAGVLLGLGGIFYTELMDNTYLIGVLMIVAGVIFILSSLLRISAPPKEESGTPPDESTPQ